MKTPLIIAGILLLFINSNFGQSSGKLLLDGNRLKGSCENKYYSGFEIELDTMYTSLDSTSLFKQFPRVGTINFKNRIDIPTEFTITKRSGTPQIMFRFNSNYHTFDDLQIDNQSISFTVANNPVVPATEADLRIVRIAKKLLSEEKYWNKEDDRNCEDDLANKSYSLYCALRLSSLEVENRYNHRNAVLQKLRHLIELKYPNKKWNHRLMDYNNMEETTFMDIVEMLDEIEDSFAEEIKKKE